MPDILKKALQMTKKEMLTEVKQLREFIGSIPAEARQAYEKILFLGANPPYNGTLLGQVEKIEKINHRNSIFPWLAFGCMLVGFFLTCSSVLYFGKMDVGERPSGWIQILPLIICSIPALVFSIKIETPMASFLLKEPILDLREKIKQLGLKPGECTEEGFKRVLSNLAFQHLSDEASFDLFRFNKQTPRNHLIQDFGIPLLESEENLRHTIEIVRQFGYEFDRADLLKDAQNKLDLMSKVPAKTV